MKLAYKVLLILIATIFSILSLTTSFEISQLRQQFEKESQSLHQTILANMLPPLASSSYNFDEDGIQRILQSSFEFGHIRQLALLDEKAEVVSAWAWQRESAPQNLAKVKAQELGIEPSSYKTALGSNQSRIMDMLVAKTLDSSGRKRLVAPLWYTKDGNQKFLGHVFLDYSTESVENLIRESILAKLGSAFLLALVLCLCVFVVTRLVVLKRLETLKTGVDRIRQRDYGVDLKVKGSDEIATLSNAFSDMLAEIASYQKNLEDRVQERTRDLQRSRDKVKLILDHIDEGILTFSSDLKVDAEFSQKTCSILEKKPDDLINAPLLDVVFKRSQLTPDAIELMHESLSFSLGMDELAWLGNSHNFPTEIQLDDKFLSLSWVPIVDEQAGVLERVLLTVRDISRERRLESERRQEELRNQRILALLKCIQHSGFNTTQHFLKHGADIVQNQKRGGTGSQGFLIEMHSLKGEARTMHLGDLAELAHEVESALKTQDIVNNSDLLEKMAQAFADYQTVLELLEHSHGEESVGFLASTAKILENIAERSLEAGLMPGVLTVADEAQDIEEGVMNKILRPSLIHALNNALDHGYIFPEAREQQKKPVHIEVRAFNEGNNRVVEVRDQGYGINAEVIYRKAREKGISTDGLNPEDIIFLPEFSTASAVSVTSGRGVGMAAIKTLVEAHQGSVIMQGQDGGGTVLTIRLPKSLHVQKSA